MLPLHFFKNDMKKNLLSYETLFSLHLHAWKQHDRFSRCRRNGNCRIHPNSIFLYNSIDMSTLKV